MLEFAFSSLEGRGAAAGAGVEAGAGAGTGVEGRRLPNRPAKGFPIRLGATVIPGKTDEVARGRFGRGGARETGGRGVGKGRVEE